MSMPPSAWRRAARAGLASLRSADALDAQATKLAERFEAAFWCDDLGTYALALDGESGRAGCEPPMPDMCCSAASPRPSARQP